MIQHNDFIKTIQAGIGSKHMKVILQTFTERVDAFSSLTVKLLPKISESWSNQSTYPQTSPIGWGIKLELSKSWGGGGKIGILWNKKNPKINSLGWQHTRGLLRLLQSLIPQSKLSYPQHSSAPNIKTRPSTPIPFQYLGLPYGSKKNVKISIFIEDLSRNSVFFWHGREALKYPPPPQTWT